MVEPRSLATVVGRTMPIGFRLGEMERKVLNAMGSRTPLTAAQVSEISEDPDGLAFIQRLITKLATHGLDLIGRGPPAADGSDTFILRS
jgi:hypothetical protein